MAKVAMLLPNHELMEPAAYAAALYHLDLVLIGIVSKENVRELSRNALQSGADIIIARGSHASLIRNYVQIPVIEIKITSLEIGLLLDQAKKLAQKEWPTIALTGPENMFAYIDLNSYEKNYQIHLLLRQFIEPEEMVPTAKQAIADGADVLIGGGAIYQYCLSHSFPCVKTASGRESALEACRIASLISSALDQEKRHAASLKMLLDYTFSGIIHIDEHGRVLNVNRFVENMLMMESSAMEQMPVWRLIPGISQKLLKAVLEKQKTIHSISVSIEHSEFSVRISPILVDGQTAGAIINFYEGLTLEAKDAQQRKQLTKNGYTAHATFDRLIARSAPMREIIQKARYYSNFQQPILIIGEAGTEKQAVGECIHNAGSYRDNPFIRFNCNGYNPEEVDQLLFGKTPDGINPGLIYRGPCTLYLHEINRLSLYSQYQLFRQIQSSPLSPSTEQNRIRLIASSKTDLLPLVENGSFRRDLYYALTIMTLRLPPLRERPEDIIAWIDFYLRDLQAVYGKYIKLTEDARKLLAAYPWPGNILELRSVCSRILINCSGCYADAALVKQQLDFQPGPSRSEEDNSPSKGTFQDQKVAAIRESLTRHHGNRAATAEELGISPATLWRWCKKYGIDRKEGKDIKK